VTDKEIVDPEWCKVTGVGLSIVGKPTFDDVQFEFVKWALVHRVSAFALGDLLVYSERRWGETYAQLSAITTLSPEYLYNVKYVCEKVPFSRRNENLSFSHHQAVASIKDQGVQSAWLLVAETYDMTRDELRQTIATGESPTDYMSSLRSSSQEVPKQMVFDPPELDLYEVVTEYIRSRVDLDVVREREYYRKMEALVEHLL
jgi:hypothetical protein